MMMVVVVVVVVVMMGWRNGSLVKTACSSF
jgi:hypothetical protein